MEHGNSRMSSPVRANFSQWFSTDGREPSSPKPPRRPLGGDQSRPASGGHWLLIIAMMVGLTLWSFVSDKANRRESIYRACIESGRSANLCSALIRGPDADD
jgi:hypothetical protein